MAASESDQTDQACDQAQACMDRHVVILILSGKQLATVLNLDVIARSSVSSKLNQAYLQSPARTASTIRGCDGSAASFKQIGCLFFSAFIISTSPEIG